MTPPEYVVQVAHIEQQEVLIEAVDEKDARARYKDGEVIETKVLKTAIVKVRTHGDWEQEDVPPNIKRAGRKA